MTMRLFAQITKVDAAKRLVYGRACQEVLDRSGEIFDYASSKPYFKAWSDGIAKDTDGKNLGNVRAMHGKVSAGKVTAIDFHDADKAVDICAKVVDDNEWNKTLEGCYTGFSIGGSYVGDKTTEKMADGSEAKRYTADPTEISLVDQPCVPTAKFFDIVKADGVVEKVAFKERAEEVGIVGTPEQVDEFTKALAEGALSIADATALVKAAIDAKANPPAEPHPLVKAVTEALAAGDALRAEMDAAKGDDFDALAAKYLTADEISTLAKSSPNTLSKSLRDAAVAKAGSLQKVHDMIGELGAKCATKAAEAGDLQKITPDVVKLLEAQAARIEKLEKQPVPYVTLRAMVASKGGEKAPVDVSRITLKDIPEEELIKNGDGTVDHVTSLFMAREKALAAAGNS